MVLEAKPVAVYGLVVTAVPFPVGTPTADWMETSQAVSVPPAVQAKVAPLAVIAEEVNPDGDAQAGGKMVRFSVTTESQPLAAAPAHTLV
jgi:hypothetical protein